MPVVGDKVTRAHPITGSLEVGKFLLPRGADRVLDFLRSVSTFPDVAHGNDVSVLVGLITQLRKSASGATMALLKQLRAERQAAIPASAATGEADESEESVPNVHGPVSSCSRVLRTIEHA